MSPGRPGNRSFPYEFFKVYLPDQSSQRMRVPPAFVKLINGAIPNKAVLKDLGGNFWHVEMEVTGNGVFLKDGWQRFASDHSLELGNFLVFTYHGDSSLDVKIFGNNGCLKEALGEQCINKRPSAVEKSNIHVKVEKLSEEGLTCPVVSRSCKRKYAEVAMKSYEKSNGSNEESQRRSLRIGSKTIEQRRAFETSEFSSQKNPHFIGSVCRSSSFRVDFSRKFLAENGIKMEPETSLRDDDGKKWPVCIYHHSDGRVSIGKGWADFRNHHKIVCRAKCAFEFILRRGRKCREIAVHILHAEGK